MTTLVLHIELDGGTPAEVADYGRRLVMWIDEQRTHQPDEPVSIECRAGQVRYAGVEPA